MRNPSATPRTTSRTSLLGSNSLTRCRSVSTLENPSSTEATWAHKGAVVAAISAEDLEELFEVRALLEPCLLCASGKLGKAARTLRDHIENAGEQLVELLRAHQPLFGREAS